MSAYQDQRRRQREEPEFDERQIEVARTAKVLKGGRRFGFRVVTVLGDNRGRVGVGIGKANEVPEAMRKSNERAKKNMVRIPLVGHTIPHEVVGRHAAASVLLRPAAPGTGVIAGHAARAVLEAAGIGDILTKSLGSDNVVNVTFATFAALRELKDPAALARSRGKSTTEVAPFWSRFDGQ